jgi:hypothetical protein
VGVFSSKVDVLALLQLFAEESIPGAPRMQIDLQVDSVVDDDVEFVLELLHLIGIAADINHLLLVGLEDAVALDDFPDGLLVFGESCVFGVDLGLILDSDLLILVLQNFH